METIGAFDAKTYFSTLLQRVENGERIIITRHGKPVAELVPTTQSVKRDPVAVKKAIRELKKFRKGNTLAGLNWKELRDEGRR